MGQTLFCFALFMLDSLYTRDTISGHCIKTMLGGVLAKEDNNEAGQCELTEQKR